MIVMTPFLLLAGIGSAGAGHGDYFIAKLLFPFTMLSTIVFNEITILFLVLALVQFPLYGVLLGLTNRAGNLIPATIGLAVFHIGAAVTCVLLVGENFS